MLKLALFAAAAFALAPSSGLNAGDSVAAFHPRHVTGPLKGTDACPP